MYERTRSETLSLLSTVAGLIAGIYMIVGGVLVMQEERAWSTTFWMIEAFKSESIDEVVAWLAIAGGIAAIVGALLSRRHFTIGGLLMLAVDAGGLFFVYVSPDPLGWFYLWPRRRCCSRSAACSAACNLHASCGRWTCRPDGDHELGGRPRGAGHRIELLDVTPVCREAGTQRRVGRTPVYFQVKPASFVLRITPPDPTVCPPSDP